MTPTKKLLLSLALACSFQGLSLAQHELILKDHHHLLKGEVVSSTADSVTFNHVVGETADTQTYAVADIDPHSFYLIRSHAVENDAAGKVALARYCEANGLFTRAQNLYAEAKKLDPSLDVKAGIDKCASGNAEELLAKAQASANQGDFQQAQASAAAVIRRFPGTPSADQARTLSQTMQEKLTADREAKAAASAAKHGSAEISAVQSEIHRAADKNTKALLNSSTSAAQREFEDAIKDYTSALKKLEKLAKSTAANDAMAKEVAGLVAQTKKDLVDVYVNLGSVFVTRTDYQGALKEANAAIAVDPESSTAKSFRAQVASASADSDIEIYGRRRGILRR